MDTHPPLGVTNPTTLGADARLVRASGLCVSCDTRFTDELVWRVADSAAPGGVVYVERRHVEPADG